MNEKKDFEAKLNLSKKQAPNHIGFMLPYSRD